MKKIITAVLALCALAPLAQAQVEGKIKTVDGTVLQGKIRWFPAAKKYTVASVGSGGAMNERELPLAQVADIAVAKPAKLDAAIKAVTSGSASAAIPTLQEIVKSYAMLKWDEVAGSYLAQAQLAVGDIASATKTCDSIISLKPEKAYAGALAPTYWQVLLKGGNTAKLESLIGKAISGGDNVSSATALIMRGDMFMEKKDYIGALKDGYLQVVILYKGVKDVQPEALYKAAKAFEALSRMGDAEKMKSDLRSKFPKSDYARMI